jgi:hypothetical protein
MVAMTSREPDEMRSDLVAYVDPKDLAGQAALMSMPRQKSWGSVVEEFVRHKDRKYVFRPDGQANRRHVLVRRRNPVGPGTEANRV